MICTPCLDGSAWTHYYIYTHTVIFFLQCSTEGKKATRTLILTDFFYTFNLAHFVNVQMKDIHAYTAGYLHKNYEAEIVFLDHTKLVVLCPVED